VWRFEPDPATRPDPLTWEAIVRVPYAPEAEALAKDLKRRGWRFVGPTTVYAFMQAMGLVNDHVDGCGARAAVEGERRALAGIRAW
jgi:DNA-3-methyladenine glycosylase I